MVTYPVDFPVNLAVNSLSVIPNDSVSSTRSKFTFARKVYDWSGEMWTIEGTLPLATRADAALYKAFFLKLKGGFGTFTFPVAEKLPQGSVGAGVEVDGGGNTGGVLNLRNLAASTTGIIKAGDWLQLGSGLATYLHMALDDVDSNASGKGSVNIWPSLRVTPAHADPVVFTNCKGLFSLTDNVGWSKDVNKHFSMSFSAVEAINA